MHRETGYTISMLCGSASAKSDLITPAPSAIDETRCIYYTTPAETGPTSV